MTSHGVRGTQPDAPDAAAAERGDDPRSAGAGFVWGARLRSWWPVAAVLMVAALLRIALIALDHGVTLDSDEAVIGLMGRDILGHATRPVFFYGQEYMGAFEAYLAALAFAVAGPSTVVLKAMMLALNLGLVLSFVALGSEISGRRAGWLAGLYAAVPPAFLAIYGLKARGGYVETLAVGNLLLAGAISLRRSGWRTLLLRCATLGFLAGVGFWTHTLVAIYFPAVAVLWLASVPRARWLATLTTAVAGAALGSAPFWWRNVHTGFQSFGNVRWVDPATALGHLMELSKVALPTVVGARGIWAFDEVLPGAGAVAMVLNLVLAAGLFRDTSDESRGAGSPLPAAAVWATALLVILVDAASSYGGEAREPRYLFPVYTALGVGFGVTVARIWATRRWWACLAAGALLAFHLFGIVRQDPSLMLGISAGQRVARSNDRLLSVLDRLAVHSVYTDYWVSYRLAFESGERIRARPFGHVVVERIPAMSEAVDRDPNPAFVLLGDAATGFRAALVRRGLGFKEREVSPYRVFYRVQSVDEVRHWTYPFN